MQLAPPIPGLAPIRVQHRRCPARTAAAGLRASAAARKPGRGSACHRANTPVVHTRAGPQSWADRAPANRFPLADIIPQRAGVIYRGAARRVARWARLNLCRPPEERPPLPAVTGRDLRPRGRRGVVPRGQRSVIVEGPAPYPKEAPDVSRGAPLAGALTAGHARPRLVSDARSYLLSFGHGLIERFGGSLVSSFPQA